jgi:folate-binding protein YgfZ
MTALLADQYRAARERAGFFHGSAGLIVVAGRDRGSYLQGLLTNDTAVLGPGGGCYAAYLTPQGRMITDLWVHELGDTMLLRTQPDFKDTLLARLDQFIFSEDVQLGDVTNTFSPVAIVGPHGEAVVAHVLGTAASSLPPEGEGSNRRLTFDGEPAIAVRPTSIGVAGIELLVPSAQLEAVDRALSAHGADVISRPTVDVLRLEEGVPLFGVDMNDETIPLEAGIESRAISFTKGCYVGQEVIIRVLHRGHGRIARKLVGVAFDAGGTVGPGAALNNGDKTIGHVTSSIRSIALDRPIALAYVKRDFSIPGTPVVTGDGVAGEVVPLPFSR